MQKQRRWIKSVIETAKTETTAMPWQRGNRRTAFAAKRQALSLKTRTA
jgi:hypothetical protein